VSATDAAAAAATAASNVVARRRFLQAGAPLAPAVKTPSLTSLAVRFPRFANYDLQGAVLTADDGQSSKSN